MKKTIVALRNPLAYAKVRRRFRDEILLLEGGHESTSARPSVLHFTVERAASRFVGSLMRSLALSVGMTPANFDGYFFELGKIKEWVIERGGPGASFFKPQGYYYGPLRTSTEHLLRREGFRTLLSLRDPRDALVSLYHNYAHEPANPSLAGSSHRRQKTRKREAFQAQSIDDFVLRFFQEGSHIRKSYEAYCEFLVGRSDVLFVRYEDMVGDFDSWLDRILGFFEFDTDAEAVRRIREETNFEPTPGGPKRQVEPGEHLQVLRPETVRRLNSESSEILGRLGYEPG